VGREEHTGWSAWAIGCLGTSRLKRTMFPAVLVALVFGWWPGAVAIEAAISVRSEGRPIPVPSPKAARGTTDQFAARGALSAQAICDKKLGEFWQAKDVSVRGTDFWLWRVFTIDTNIDGRTDDVGFILKAEGQKDLVVRYIKTIGAISGRTVPALRLDDETDIPRLCFGQVTFERPVPPIDKPFIAFKVPDLSSKKGAGESSPELPETPEDWWPEALGASIFLIIGFGSAGFLTRYCRSSSRRKAGDRRAKGRRGSSDRRGRGTKDEGASEKRTGERRKGEKRKGSERRTKADRRNS
jgi:hypothetical protein